MTKVGLIWVIFFKTFIYIIDGSIIKIKNIWTIKQARNTISYII